MIKAPLARIRLGICIAALTAASLPAQRHSKLTQSERDDSQQAKQQRQPAPSDARNTQAQSATAQPEGDGKNDRDQRVLHVEVVDSEWHFWLPIVINSIIALVGIITAGAVWHQAGSNREAARAATASAEAIISAERAWLLVTPTKWSSTHEAFGPAMKTEYSQFVLAIKNVGKTPAHINSSDFRYVILNDLAHLPAEPDYAEAAVFKSRLLTPQDSYQETREVEGWKLPEQGNELFALLRDHQRFLYSFGYVKYNDDFGRERETRVGYILEFQPQGAAYPTVFRRQAGPAAYNRAT